MKHASYEITQFKALDGGPKGLFAAMVSVFGNVDKNGDRVLKGAFTKSLDRWRSSNSPIPVIWSHEHKNPESYIGEVHPQDVKETQDGLVVAGKLDIESNPAAARVYDLLLHNRVKEWSFGYEVKDERIADDLARELLEVDLIEVGPTLKGANPDVRTLAVKEDPAVLEVAELDPLIARELDEFELQIDGLIEDKIGRVISSKTEAKIRSALQALTDILAKLGEEPTEQASSSPEAKQEPEPPSESEQLHRELERVGLFLAERQR